MTKRVIVTRGLPASGKSSYCRSLVEQHPGQYKIISNDELRRMLDNGRFSRSNEKFMLKARDALILLALEEGRTPLVDGTHFNPTHETHIQNLVKSFGAVVEVKDFTDVPVDVCVERDRGRWPSVGEAVIRKMWREHLAPRPEPPAYNPTLPDCVIIDLDGTLAIIGDRNPYDASRCDEVDTVNDAVRYVHAMVCDRVPLPYIFLLSGRSEAHQERTERWLDMYGISYDYLHMRAAGDTRKDTIIKREMYDKYIAGNYNVRFVLDDRTSVVDMWRYDIGLPTFQVAPGDF